MMRSRYIRLYTLIHCGTSLPGNLYGTSGASFIDTLGAAPRHCGCRSGVVNANAIVTAPSISAADFSAESV